MDTETAVRRWVAGWSQAWPGGDAARVAALYADGAVFFSHPFREAQAPKEYALWAFGEQSEATCRFGEPVVSGDRAAVDWCAVIIGVDGSVETVAGTSLLRFAADGLVLEQRDAWSGEPGRRELPHWAQST